MFRLKTLTLMVIIISLSHSLSVHNLNNVSDLVKTVKQIVFSEHRRDIKVVNVINGLRNQNVQQVDNFMQDLFREIGSKIAFRSVNLSQLIQNVRLFFNIVIINSLDSFEHFASEISSEYFNFGGYYVIIFETASFDDQRFVFKTLWDFYINNVNILTRDKANGFVTVTTFIPFSEFGCNRTTPTKIAEFKNGRFIHQPNIFFPDKFSNFYKCPLKVSTFESLAPSVLREDFANGSYRLYGKDVEVMTALSYYLNFTNDVFYITPYGGWGFIYPNGTVTGSIGRAMRREAEYALGNLYLQYNRSLILEFSYTYFLDQLVLVIPPGKPLTSFQKLLRPFNIFVWIALGGTFLCAFLVIGILQFQSERVKECWFGEGVKNPYMNVVIAIFGGTQHLVPSRNFARSLLMIFLLFCLVIR